jgi:hypothetical protein
MGKKTWKEFSNKRVKYGSVGLLQKGIVNEDLPERKLDQQPFLVTFDPKSSLQLKRN